jgi:hypothetical protein
VIPRKRVVSQHKFVVAVFCFQVCVHRDKQDKIARTSWWKLKGEEGKKSSRTKRGRLERRDDTNNTWEKIATYVRKVVSEVCGVTKGSGGEAKDTWWLNEEVQRAIKEKKECYKRLYHDRNVDNIEKYKVAKKTTKQALNVVKGRAYEDLYQRLSTKEEEKDIYRLAKVRERKIGDFNHVKCIKDETEHLLVKEDGTRHRCQKYFNKLFNGDTTF